MATGVLIAGGALGPMELAEQRESVSLGLLVLMSNCRRPKRAVFILREAFGYSHREVAELVDMSEENFAAVASPGASAP
ncbi:MAG: hypothetical protein ACR2JG_01555 [Geodermatophilaceae bacterium]